jgi:hypothetical protein
MFLKFLAYGGGRRSTWALPSGHSVGVSGPAPWATSAQCDPSCCSHHLKEKNVSTVLFVSGYTLLHFVFAVVLYTGLTAFLDWRETRAGSASNQRNAVRPAGQRQPQRLISPGQTRSSGPWCGRHAGRSGPPQLTPFHPFTAMRRCLDEAA